ncbi:LysR family transcriptional regulator [Lentzea aerocolonigenes]|uniref:LysR family transcriptional regulator n=1 Tax=Lentzea aerocolonigenes TaxID=68170 RepID=UPI0005EC5CDC|nr:LysR family transcriptional regulator [Lentzea aerocolonigenes]
MARSWGDELDGLDGLEIRHLRYFLAVARAGKIMTAAQELNIAQPSLSQLIGRLERRLDLVLFDRTARGVELTAAGEVFRRGVERMLSDLDEVLAEAGSAARVARIGVCSGVAPALLGDIENAIVLKSETPVRVEFRAETSSRQLELLRTGELDFAIVRMPLDDGDFEVAVVDDQVLGVVLHTEHPLAGRAALRWTDLAGQRLLWFDARRAPGYAQGLLAELSAHGWRPRLHTADNDRHALFSHTLRSVPNLVALRPRSTVDGDPQLAWIPIAGENAPRERLGLAALRDGGHGETVRRMP